MWGRDDGGGQGCWVLMCLAVNTFKGGEHNPAHILALL